MEQNDNIAYHYISFSSKFSNNSFWTEEEDNKLTLAYELHNGKNWKSISEYVNTKSSIQCLHRWSKVLSKNYLKGGWTVEEDKKLKSFVNMYGDKDFSSCGKIIPQRTSKQCRERWFNVLHPKLKKGDWSLEEDYLIFKLFCLYGGKWIYFIPLFKKKRSENSLKNRFYSTIRRLNTELKKHGKSASSDYEKVFMILEKYESKLMTKHNLTSKEELSIFNKNAYSLEEILKSYNNPRDIFFEIDKDEEIEKPKKDIFKVERSLSYIELYQIIKLCQYFECNIKILDETILPKIMNLDYNIKDYIKDYN